ncbi:MAG TPA: tail fiber domain-containing protein [Candidatus Udaeobacter sp.]|nr:tail fiber domain-containing protein [Candidatus Udaeobacter sp.]
MNPLIQLKKATSVFFVAMACFALFPTAQAVVPAPDGGYPGGNTAEGDNALFSLTTGASNTAIGFAVLGSNTTGDFNTAEGSGALLFNTTGFQNTATGVNALVHNTTGSSNTASGVNTLFHNTTGFQNAATGVQSLFSNTTGFHNTAAGFQALFSNTTGNHNTADGDNALVHTTTGILNTAIGAHALDQNVTGSSNVALGFQAGLTITGSGNVCIGENILGLTGESNVTRIRNIGSTAQANGVFVTVGAGGKLGFQVSSRRYKDDIKPMDKASEALFALKPVSFRYKQEIDPARSPDFGLIAEDVAIVNPDLVARDEEGKIVTVRYQAVYAMLLNEFLKSHSKVQEQVAVIAQVKSNAAKQEATIARQQKQIEALTEGLQKVSAQLEAGKTSPRIVLNDQ